MADVRDVTHIVFGAYIEKATAAEKSQVNVAILKNLLDVVEETSPGLQQGFSWHRENCSYIGSNDARGQKRSKDMATETLAQAGVAASIESVPANTNLVEL